MHTGTCLRLHRSWSTTRLRSSERVKRGNLHQSIKAAKEYFVVRTSAIHASQIQRVKIAEFAGEAPCASII